MAQVVLVSCALAAQRVQNLPLFFSVSPILRGSICLLTSCTLMNLAIGKTLLRLRTQTGYTSSSVAECRTHRELMCPENKVAATG